MPIPKPIDGEERNEFMQRCMGEIVEEYEQEQAFAICLTQWEGEEDGESA